MKCLRCGYCCSNYFVVIVDDPEKGIDEDNLICHEGKSACKHLKGSEPGKYSCTVHNYLWYDETPCFSHGQIEQKDSNCRMGEYILKQENKKCQIT